MMDADYSDLTWSGRVQSDIDELISLLNSARNSAPCGLCDGSHPMESPKDAILCRHHENFVHLGCCTEKCSWHGEPCRHAILIHE